MRRGLERQKREKMIDIGPHLARTARPPSPDAWADIVDDGDRRAALPDAFCYGVSKLGAVDDDDRIGIEGKRRVHGAVNPAHELRQAGENGGRSHDRDVGEREDGW